MIVRTIAPEGLPRPTGDEGHVLLDAIWSLFAERLVWPVFDDIDRALYGQGLEWESTVQQLCPALLRGLDPNLLHTPQPDQTLSLTVAGAANCTGAGPVLKRFLIMVRTAATIEKNWRPPTPGDRPRLTNIDLEEAVGPDRIVSTALTYFAVMQLGIQEPCFQGGGHDPAAKSWSLGFTREIRPYADVASLEDYWRIRAQALGPERTEADLRPFSKREPEMMLQPPLFAEPAPAAVSPESMSVTCNLHPEIAEVAAERYDRGAYNDAVRSAFQAVEHRVHTMVPPTTLVGDRLMGYALNTNAGEPLITVTRSTGNSLDSERTGMQSLFKGAMQALRNPRSHGPDEKDDRDEADEMLVFASFLMRRLDIEDDKGKAAGSGS
ncbi:TIGR02391 family protein [Streptomyces sp. NBC_01800]|uniref:TIGR02391 family protein n=1 Tax=Streptomyces sp. NBC_01800 TaxID=2975945 RepID=UPI002DD8F51A|nr:TIGR02391 family protein [Streptomyces sp. NBC_01800]WSA68753.1 TIGR02391 family protein [Streptomyces sp. NBC_01800]